MASGYFSNQARSLDKDEISGSNIYPGTFIAIVKDNKDVGQKAGRLWVYVPEFGGEEDNPNSWIAVSYASPFYGISPHAPPRDDKESELPPVTTYGFWAIPPDIDVRVLCTFVKGRQTLGYWFAVVPTLSHSMVPANGAPDGKTPVMDLNPYDPKNNNEQDLSSIKRQPYEALSTQFNSQGIAEDPLRGPITSSSFRESPSRVFGISSQSTPESPGHTFVMDDGGEDGKNKLIRLRTAGGNQITMHDDTGMIYLINSGGTGWVEISPSGQIDVYGEKGINMATPGDINFHADNNINLHANNCIKIVASNGTKVMGGSELQLHGGKTMIEGVDSLHVHSCKEMMFTSFADIHMKAFNYFCLKGKCFYWNSCTAKEAEQVPPEKPQDVSGYQTTVARAPSKEPYKEHDNGSGAGAGASSGEQQSTAPDGSASGTGPGGMFGGEASTGSRTPMDTAATSLGNNFNLNFKTGLPGNKIGTGANNWGSGLGQTQPRDSSIPRTSVAASNTFTPPEAARTTNIQGAVRTNSSTTVSSTYSPATTVNNTSVTADAALTGSFTTNYGANKPSTLTVNTSTTTQVGPNVGTARTTTTTQNIDVSSAEANTYLGRGGAQPVGADPALANVPDPQNKPAGVFDSPNPADQALTGQTPAQDASSALGQMAGMSPSSDLPAAPGGGGSGCFATGDNCQRPVDETGGAGGAAGDSAQPGQKNFTPPDELKNDPEFQKKLAEMKEKYPGLTDQQIYNVIGGESGFNFAAVNSQSGATGAFQFLPSTASGLGYSTAQIQAMTPAQQLGVYDQYLSSNGYKGGPLGIMQAAPAYAGRSGSTIVYQRGSAAWNQNPGWRGSDGNITVDSINKYYGY